LTGLVFDRRRFGAACGAALLTSTLLWRATGLDPLWPLLWIAPVPVLIFACRASWWGAALSAFLAWLLGSLNMWGYYHGVLELPPVILVSIFLSEALVFTIAAGLSRSLLRRGKEWWALLAFPAAWVTYEYLRNVTSPHGTAGSLAYSQLNFLPFLQFASVTGPWGMTFMVMLFPAAVAIAIYLRGRSSTQALRILAASSGLVALVLVYGTIRLAPPAPQDRVKVGLVASDLSGNVDVAEEGPATTRLMQAYEEHAALLAAQGAEVIVLPEKLGVIVDPDTEKTDALLQDLANRAGADIVVGLIHVAPLKYSQARIYSPGVPMRSYDKHHLLPQFESGLVAGTSLTLLRRRSSVWGVAICKDMDFTPLSRQYGRAGAGLMLVPAWDFVVDRWAHGHMAVMRGVESGFALARSAKQGFLTVSDHCGRIVAETTSDAAAFVTLLAEVPAAHCSTPCLLLGDWFAWLSLAVLGLSLAQLFPIRRP
jgi:apolipoprotein N-acyltransferase